MGKNKKGVSKLIKRIVISLIVILILYISLNMITIYNYGKVDEIRKTDTAIILGAAVQGDCLSPVFKERINHGIWLYRNNYVKVLIFTGGYSVGNDFSDASIAQKYAVEQGIPVEDIMLEEESTITQENLSYAKQIMDKNKLKSAIIVSDPLHMKRAMLMAQDAGIEAYTSPTPTTRYKSLKTKTGFLVREVFFYIGYKVYRIFS